jgi:hypothetical protein
MFYILRWLDIVFNYLVYVLYVLTSEIYTWWQRKRLKPAVYTIVKLFLTVVCCVDGYFNNNYFLNLLLCNSAVCTIQQICVLPNRGAQRDNCCLCKHRRNGQLLTNRPVFDPVLYTILKRYVLGFRDCIHFCDIQQYVYWIIWPVISFRSIEIDINFRYIFQ